MAKLLSERTKAFVHTISERKKSGKVTALPPLPATLVSVADAHADLIGGQCHGVNTADVAQSHVLRPFRSEACAHTGEQS